MPGSLTPLEDSLRARLRVDGRIGIPIHAWEPAEMIGVSWNLFNALQTETLRIYRCVESPRIMFY